MNESTDFNAADLNAVILRFRLGLRGFIRQQVRDDAVADDLAQEAWLRITQRFGQLRDGQKIEAWIYRIARNIVADHFRRHHETTVLPDELPAPPDNRAIEETQQQHYDYIRDVVGNLPQPHREALTLTIYEGLSQRQLAERLGISLTAAKSRVQRARTEVRKIMEACCRWKFDALGNIIDCEPREKCHCG